MDGKPIVYESSREDDADRALLDTKYEESRSNVDESNRKTSPTNAKDKQDKEEVKDEEPKDK